MKHINTFYPNACFWEGKRVFVTGHTGFKGGWICKWLTSLGARVSGYSLPPTPTAKFYNLNKLEKDLDNSFYSDIRNLEFLKKCIINTYPEVIFHMAAQPLVRYSYINSVETYEINVMGTVHLLEAIKHVPSVKSVVVVTSDKCYENSDLGIAFSEQDRMGGDDPYSNSKGCAELVVSAYRKSFFEGRNKPSVLIGTVRAGNVIGGGDWSDDRLIPDAFKAYKNNQDLLLRAPNSTRPWQHVLDPLAGYLMLAQALFMGKHQYAGGWNFGPQAGDVLSVKEIISILSKNLDNKLTYKFKEDDNNFHEAKFLMLSCEKSQNMLGWKSKIGIKKAIELTADWHKHWLNGSDMASVTLSQISSYSTM
jgi:CDP-glucose 4,6-dehydratase